MQHKTGTKVTKRSLVQKLKQREELCENLQADLPIAPNMTEVTAKKTYFEFINLGAIKNRITVRFERKAFELKIDDPK